ncbi:hypothetical protein NGRA_2888 [Nosema granulosis]|uniref:Uncharacterized protein n=1 Tax=Nosema granulosis TaxID=83296 RepID=A0A9P6GWW0_9MICR|nr:hypothetical protein NGRA_2888 [Nosema granulosis]
MRESDIMKMKRYLEEAILVYEKKIKISNNRKEYRRQNRKYELYRERFYRDLEGNNTFDIGESLINTEDIDSFWSKMWNREEDRKKEKVQRNCTGQWSYGQGRLYIPKSRRI